MWKVARDMKKEVNDGKTIFNSSANIEPKTKIEISRVSKARKWKSTKIEELNIKPQFAGPFLTLADIILLPSYYLLMKLLGDVIKDLLSLTFNWYLNIINISEMNLIINILNEITSIKTFIIDNLILPQAEDVSLYKSSPKKRLYTKPEDIEIALNSLTKDLELEISLNNNNNRIIWETISDGANPSAGHLPNQRIKRKSQQLENLGFSMAKDQDFIVDFCSGSGHMGLLIAYLLPKCTVILLENKELLLLRAKKRVHEMGLTNVFLFQCNLDFFIGNFDIGIALHACGIATDLVLGKCLKANAQFVLCPCCYGFLHVTNRLIYFRSKKISSIPLDNYLCINHTADQTHENHPLTERGSRCMAIIDSDRGSLAEEHGYTVTLSKLRPLSCTPKNNLLIGVPS